MTTTNSKPNSSSSANAGMTMSPEARAKMRNTEKAVLKYYNDLGRNKGNCTWGIGFYHHRGVCTPEELKRKVDAASIDIEYNKRIAEAERRVKLKVQVPLNQAQFDGLVSFTYNTKNVTNQEVYSALNRNDFATAAKIMSGVIKSDVDGKLKMAPGLITRRAEESAPFRNAAEISRQESK